MNNSTTTEKFAAYQRYCGVYEILMIYNAIIKIIITANNRRNLVIFQIIIFFTSTAIINHAKAQSKQASIMIGNKSLEISGSYTVEDELIFGAALSATDTNKTEKRANRNDRGKVHKFNDAVTPAVFGLIGGKFDNISIIGKIGSSYVDQTINGNPTKDLFLAVGITVDYKISETIGMRGSYDSVNSIMAGLTFHFN